MEDHGALVEHAPTRLGRQRQLSVRLPSFAAALPVVARTDLDLVAPSRLTKLDSGRVRAWEAPIFLLEHLVTPVWPERLHTDTGHRQFRERIVEAVFMPSRDTAVIS